MVQLAFLFILTGIEVALALNVARRSVQARFAVGALPVVATLAAAGALWLASAITVIAAGGALVTALVAFRLAGANESERGERLQGSLIGLAVLEIMILVAGSLVAWLARSDGF